VSGRGHHVDYESLMSAAPSQGAVAVALFLREVLPSLWRDAYLKTITHQPNLARLRVGTFEYLCDIYSDLESKGEVAYDQSLQDRVVAAFGTSYPAESANPRQSRRWIDPTLQLSVTERDHGHLIAQCLGGTNLGLNFFSQDRKLNRGHSVQGKIYRQMERYIHQQPGTFCFSRPIYADASNVPKWMEFGVLKNDQTLWVEVFDN